LLAADVALPFEVHERRLGLDVAAIRVEGTHQAPRFSVRYPTDRDYPPGPSGHRREPTSRTIDLLLRPLFGYELGRFTKPVQIRFQLEPLLRYNPWPGARATASLVVPVYNDFDPSVLHPDEDEVRPGLLTLEQFAWFRPAALVSATGGVLGDNRYGVSFGAARPLYGGRVLLDSQVDLTGFIAFQSNGVHYSEMSQVSGFGGVTWFVPWWDVSLRLRGGRFLYGDEGVHLEFRRAFGDFEYSMFVLRSGGLDVQGVRISLPVPPMTRATQRPLRVQPIERLPIGYRTDATPVGEFVAGVASREDFLRPLNEASMSANVARFERHRTGAPKPETSREPVWVNSAGVTGFIFTPWAGVMPERTMSIDYTHLPKKWAYSGRNEFVNQNYSLTLGVLPRVETTLRFTRLPGAAGFLPGDPDNLITTDTDHLVGGRLVLLTPKGLRPGLATGIEDLSGTRRFHAAYLVLGNTFATKNVQSRFSFGYASRVFTAARHVLDGGFGAIEISPWRDVATRIEFDSEKWNVGLGVSLPYGLKIRAAALNLETLSAGVGWTHEL
jgi:hypothetical protein